jgi:undecaprenyl-diphosphatase
MDIVTSILLGAVEGITEFLPISSTFHLIAASQLLHLKQDEFTKLFEVFIQAGAIFAVAILYFRELKNDLELVKKLLFSFLPTAVIGFALYKVIKNVFFSSMPLMVSVFVLVGILFIFLEMFLKKNKSYFVKHLTSISYKDAVIVGLAQSFAVVPGVSRAGAVIIAMILLKYKRADAAKYSFMLSVPTILAASFFDLYKSRAYVLNHLDMIYLLLIGSVVAFITAYFVMKWFINYLKNHSLAVFGWYRIVLAIIILLVLRG